MSKFFIALVAAVAILGFASQAHATPLPPGSTVVPDISGEPSTATVVANISGNFNIGTVADGNQLIGSWQEVVYKQVTGNLDFAYQVTLTTGDIGRLTATGFKSFLISASQDDNSLAVQNLGAFTHVGTRLAFDASRSADGNKASADFNEEPVAPPSYSTYIQIFRTNATQFQKNQLNIIDSNIFSVNTDGPSPSPEPSSLVLMGGLGIGLVGGAAFRRWRKAKKAVA